MIFNVLEEVIGLYIRCLGAVANSRFLQSTLFLIFIIVLIYKFIQTIVLESN